MRWRRTNESRELGLLGVIIHDLERLEVAPKRSGTIASCHANVVAVEAGLRNQRALAVHRETECKGYWLVMYMASSLII